MEETLTCLNCQAVVRPDQAQFFEGVFVCSSCAAVASSFYQRGQKELRQLLTLLREAIRTALIEGKLHLGENKTPEDISKTDLLRAIMQLEEARSAVKKR